ncbi:transglycosylase SLT domain-containing protein, partial [Falsiroseomonas oryzae]|uniref:transglycosylase SLT domain-containing protein n=1 Tax=Falsiroseomonas oryzae TaxID=2766473 RepID=UPI0022EB012B
PEAAVSAAIAPAAERARPASTSLFKEELPKLTTLHKLQEDGVAWALTSEGIALEGEAARGTLGEPKTVKDIWSKYGQLCLAASRKWGVPVELIVATIATESRGDPAARRPEPQINDESVGLMQTLVKTARGALGEPSLQGHQLLDPAKSIDAGTAYIASQRASTHFDPPLVAAAYNAGSLRRDSGPANRWKLVCHPIGTGRHIDTFVGWFNDAMRVSRAEGWAQSSDSPSFGKEL